MHLHILDILVEDVKRLGNIFILDSFVYEPFNVHIKRAYGALSRKRAACMQEAMMLMERQQKDGRDAMGTKVRGR